MVAKRKTTAGKGKKKVADAKPKDTVKRTEVKFSGECLNFDIGLKHNFDGKYAISGVGADGKRFKSEGMCPTKPFKITVTQ